MQKVDLGKVVPSAAELMQLADAAIGSWIREHTDSTPTDGHTNRLVSSDGILKALQAAMQARQGSWVIEDLTTSATISFNTDRLNKQLFYSNGGQAENTLGIVLPADAANGDTFFLEFRSTGGSDIPAVISSFGVSEGGKLITNGELSNTAYCTRINATYAFGIWAANIETFDAVGGIQPQTYGTIVYSPSNYASATWAAITDTVQSGTAVLRGRQAGFCGMVHSGWNTAANGTGTSYGLGGEISIGADETITLYPVYNEFVDALPVQKGKGGTGASSELNRTATATLDYPSGLGNWKELYLYVNISLWYISTASDQTAEISFNGQTKTLNGGWVLDYHNYRNRADVFTNVKLTRSSPSNNFTIPNFSIRSPAAYVVPYISSITFKKEES